MPMYIPSPTVNGFYVGPAFIHVYGLMYVVGITLEILITQRRWKAVGGDPGLVGDVAIWAVRAGRIGNYFNKELFGGPTTLPWGLEIPVAYRPPGYTAYRTFHPTFLYELIFDLALAALLVWLGHHRAIRPPGLFALYVTGYSAFRIFEESLRVDPSEHFLGLRFNMYVAIIGTVAGGVWFWYTQRRGKGLPSNTPGIAAPTAAAGRAVAADAVTGGAAAGAGAAHAGEQPAGTEGEPAGAGE